MHKMTSSLTLKIDLECVCETSPCLEDTESGRLYLLFCSLIVICSIGIIAGNITSQGQWRSTRESLRSDLHISDSGLLRCWASLSSLKQPISEAQQTCENTKQNRWLYEPPT